MKTSNWWTGVFVSLGLVAIVPTSVLALNESTHELINREAVSSSQLDSLLRNNLGIPEGVLARFKDRDGVINDVLNWLREGGKREDQGNFLNLLFGRARYTRHFDDPLPPWDTAGLRFFGQSESSVRWMQRADQGGSQAVGGNWGWPTTRQLFYEALTEGSPQPREGRFADVFRALGQLMHLVTDASVPTGANVTLGSAIGTAVGANANVLNAGAEG